MSRKGKFFANEPRKVYILGAGGMAREVLEMYRSSGRINEVEGFVVSEKKRAKKLKNKKIFTDKEIALENMRGFFIGAIGNPIRRKWIEKLIVRGGEFDNIIHASVIIGKSVKHGVGNIICANSVLTDNIVISDHVIINVGATINHDCKIGSYVTIGPGVHIGGRVSIGDGTFVGIGVLIKEQIKIGRNVFIGAGAVVVDDITDNVLVYGSPARVIKKIDEDYLKDLI